MGVQSGTEGQEVGIWEIIPIHLECERNVIKLGLSKGLLEEGSDQMDTEEFWGIEQA